MLTPGRISWRVDDTTERVRGQMPLLPGSTAEWVLHQSKQVRVTTPDGRVLVLEGADEADANGWLEALRVAIDAGAALAALGPAAAPAADDAGNACAIL